jgi:hypothetical protein
MSSLDDDKNCEKCGEKYSYKYYASYKWCKSCQIDDLKNNFINWTSGNENIDDLIQEMQLKINYPEDIVFEWIPYNQFSDFNELKKSDFATVYLAIWKDGPLNYDPNKYKYTRSQYTNVDLKYLHDSQNITNELLNEV